MLTLSQSITFASAIKIGLGIEAIYREYNNSNIIFIGEGGTGKTTAFLRLYLGIGLNNIFVSGNPFHYMFAPDLQWGKNKLLFTE